VPYIAADAAKSVGPWGREHGGVEIRFTRTIFAEDLYRTVYIGPIDVFGNDCARAVPVASIDASYKLAIKALVDASYSSENTTSVPPRLV
jgi:hypothetical protein